MISVISMHMQKKSDSSVFRATVVSLVIVLTLSLCLNIFLVGTILFGAKDLAPIIGTYSTKNTASPLETLYIAFDFEGEYTIYETTGDSIETGTYTSDDNGIFRLKSERNDAITIAVQKNSSELYLLDFEGNSTAFFKDSDKPIYITKENLPVTR